MIHHHLLGSHYSLLALVVATGVLVSGTVWAEKGIEGGGACTLARQVCELTCSRQYSPGSASHAGCVVRCSTEAAGCEAAAGLSAARPWLERQMERLQQFYDGFIGEGSESPPLPPGRTTPHEGNTEKTEQGMPKGVKRPQPLAI